MNPRGGCTPTGVDKKAGGRIGWRGRPTSHMLSYGRQFFFGFGDRWPRWARRAPSGGGILFGGVAHERAGGGRRHHSARGRGGVHNAQHPAGRKAPAPHSGAEGPPSHGGMGGRKQGSTGTVQNPADTGFFRPVPTRGGGGRPRTVQPDSSSSRGRMPESSEGEGHQARGRKKPRSAKDCRAEANRRRQTAGPVGRQGTTRERAG